MKPGDEVLFGGKKFTLLEKGPFLGLWIAIETDNPGAKARALVETDLKEVPRG